MTSAVQDLEPLLQRVSIGAGLLSGRREWDTDPPQCDPEGREQSLANFAHERNVTPLLLSLNPEILCDGLQHGAICDGWWTTPEAATTAIWSYESLAASGKCKCETRAWDG